MRTFNPLASSHAQLFLHYYARLYRLEDCPQKADRALSQLKLSERAHSLVRTLSNGMQKRLSIARAMLHKPQILLLDEPVAGLDRDSISTFHGLLKEWTEAGLSVLMTTHDLDLGLSWAHRAAVLSGGRIHFPSTHEYSDGTGLRHTLASHLEPSL